MVCEALMMFAEVITNLLLFSTFNKVKTQKSPSIQQSTLYSHSQVSMGFEFQISCVHQRFAVEICRRRWAREEGHIQMITIDNERLPT